MKYEILFWDLDGTLVNSLLGVANGLEVTFKQFGIEIDSANFQKFVGPPLRRSFQPFFGSAEKLEEALTVFREYYTAKGAYEAELFPDIIETLEELKRRGYRMFVATSKREDAAIDVLTSFGIIDLFERVFGANESIGIIEKEDVLAKAFNEYDLDKSRCLMIGDTMYDVRGAQILDIDCMAALYGFGDNDELLSSDIVGSVDNVADILNVL